MHKFLARRGTFSKHFLTVGRMLREEDYFKRNLSERDKSDKKGEQDVEDTLKARKGVFSDKTQSIQEESYFHKEERELLKRLKNKGLKNQPTDDEKKKK